MVSFPEQDWHVAATIWGCSATHFHIECPTPVSPGMTLSLFFLYPGTDQALRLTDALVTWSGQGEFGIQVQQLQTGEAHQLTHVLATSGQIG